MVSESVIWGLAILVSIFLVPAIVRALVAAVWSVSAIVALCLMVAVPAGLLALLSWGIWAIGKSIGFWGG